MNDYTAQIRSFGALGYSPERIAALLNLTGKEKTNLIVRLAIPDDPYYMAYQNGLAIGSWNIDAEQAEKGDVDSISALAERSKERRIKDLKKQLFGI